MDQSRQKRNINIAQNKSFHAFLLKVVWEMCNLSQKSFEFCVF